MNKVNYIGTPIVSPAVQALHNTRGTVQSDGAPEVERGEPLLRKSESASPGLDQGVAPRQAELDKQLLLLLLAEPLNGLARIYDQYAQLVYGLARAILTNTQEAEDLTQEIF